MNTERRHELESNTLAKELNVWGEKLRPYTSLILGGLAALAGAYAVLSIWNAYGARRDAAAWDQYQLAILEGDQSLKQLQSVAASEENASAVAMQDWAYVTWADRQLLLASEEFLVNRDGAKKRLDAITAVYEQFSQEAQQPEVRNRARLGLARVAELSGRLEEARKNYAQVEGALGVVAAARSKQLEDKATQEAAKWLATAKAPSPRMPAGGGTPGAKPEFNAQPPASDAMPAGFDPSRSLEEILGGLKTEEGPTRYDDATNAAAPADAAGESSAAPTDASPADEPAEQADREPTRDAPSEPAPKQ